MVEELKEYLRDHPAKGFRPRPFYSAPGDCVIFYASNERCYAKRINELLTIYMSMESDRPVGCKIKGVQQPILSRFGKLVKSPGGTALKSLILGGIALSREVVDSLEPGLFDELADLIEGISLEEGELQQA
jgi:hypothetical protein